MRQHVFSRCIAGNKTSAESSKGWILKNRPSEAVYVRKKLLGNLGETSKGGRSYLWYCAGQRPTDVAKLAAFVPML